jgi:hypothetical protein
MPSFGTNPNLMCYLDDIFVYLRARANDAVPRGRPQKHETRGGDPSGKQLPRAQELSAAGRRRNSARADAPKVRGEER